MVFDDLNNFQQDGFLIHESFLSSIDVANLVYSLKPLALENAKGGIRRIEEKVPLINELIKSNRLHTYASFFLRDEAAFVRAIYFNKSSDNNWGVSWHQDKTIAASHLPPISHS